MTKKQYRSAMGKTVDMGSLLLQNETVRAVGNMGVNARGDVINSNNKIIEKRSKQIQRQSRRRTNVNNLPVSTGTLATKKSRELSTQEELVDTLDNLPEDNNIVVDTPVSESTDTPVLSGLAGAIARSRTVQQELEKTPRQLAKTSPGVRKL